MKLHKHTEYFHCWVWFSRLILEEIRFNLPDFFLELCPILSVSRRLKLKRQNAAEKTAWTPHSHSLISDSSYSSCSSRGRGRLKDNSCELNRPLIDFFHKVKLCDCHWSGSKKMFTQPKVRFDQ